MQSALSSLTVAFCLSVNSFCKLLQPVLQYAYFGFDSIFHSQLLISRGHLDVLLLLCSGCPEDLSKIHLVISYLVSTRHFPCYSGSCSSALFIHNLPQ